MAHPYAVVTVDPVNPRRVLGVTEDAGDDQVASAYAWIKARELDCGPSGGQAQRLARIDEAYAALLGVNKRGFVR